MNNPRIFHAAVVTGLAVTAALVTVNFIRAAESAASVPATSTMPAAASHAGFCLATDGGPASASSIPGLEKNLHWVYHAGGPLLLADHALVCALDPMPVRSNEEVPAAGAVDPSPGTGGVSTDAHAATEAARNEADLNALFAVAVRVKPARIEAARNAQGERGKRVYLDLCYACHQPDGQGLPGVFPMLAKSDYMAADRTRAIRIVLEGLAGPITVNGETMNSVMPAQKTLLTDEQIADVLTYVFNAWGNPGGAFTADQVEVIRNEKPRP